MTPREILAYYSREDIQQALINSFRQREIVGVFRNGSFGTRPNAIEFPDDILAMVRQGMYEFHMSVERWSRPMALRQDNYSDLRVGWDLILDLDCEDFRHGRIAAEAVIWGLKKHGIRNFSVKYTGGDGFHVGVPWEAMPKKIDYEQTVKLFPGLGRTVGLYLKDFVRDRLEGKLLKSWTPEEIAKQAGKPLQSLYFEGSEQRFDAFKVVDIDPVLISPRHLFRAPYSLNRKSFLVSLPLKETELEGFEKENAGHDRVNAGLRFLEKADPEEAGLLVSEALDWNTKWERKEKKKARERSGDGSPVQEAFFPPCITLILKGVQDGRKRSLFVLINFLKTMKWRWEDIEARVTEWNQKNPTPLPDSYINSQLRWNRSKGSYPPPGCNKAGYYESMGVCHPDMACGGASKSVGNPVVYPYRAMEKKAEKPKGKGPGRKAREGMREDFPDYSPE